jgi:hypothetical protein
MFGTSIEADGDELASNDDIMSLPLFVSWLVLTLYSANLRRVRMFSARDFFGCSVGAEVEAGARSVSGAGCSLFWLAHSS